MKQMPINKRKGGRVRFMMIYVKDLLKSLLSCARARTRAYECIAVININNKSEKNDYNEDQIIIMTIISSIIIRKRRKKE